MNLAASLADLRRRNIDLSAIDGKIRFRAPEGTMTPLDREFLVNNKAAILDFLKLGEGHAPGATQVPLTSPDAGVPGELESHPGRQSIGRSKDPARPSARAPSPPSRRKRGARDDSQYSHNSRISSLPVDFANIANSTMAPDHAKQEVRSSPAVEYGVADRMVVRIGDRTYIYSAWDGKTLVGDRLALDTETDIAQDQSVPALALATASDGKVHYLIHPDRLGEFLLLHRHKHIVCHNIAFDHWVIVKHLRASGESEPLAAWWGIVDDDRAHDTMHLDWLIRLGRTDADPMSRDLAVLADEFAGLLLDKDDPYRVRYGEIIGRDWETVERGFLDYAIKDPIATLAVYEEMIVEAARIMAAHGLEPDSLARQHGYLSENYQVKGSIALSEVTRIGMATDGEQVAIAEREHRERLRGLVDALIAIPECEAIIGRTRRGEMKLRPKSGAPSLREDPLRELLLERARLVAPETGLIVPSALTPSGKISLRDKDWESFAPFDPFIRTWLEMERAVKAFQIFAGLKDPVVHPRYRFARTARALSSKPNIQQMPRQGGFRESFVARPGFVLLTLDYRFIELRTLAAVCEARFGRSRLAEVIRDGLDPHVYTAAMLAGMEFEEFKALAHADDPEDRKKFDDLRQKSKPVNFGLPGGLGAAALVAYSLDSYGVEMTLEEAAGFRNKVIHEVYPELALYLADDGMETLARNLGTTVEACWGRLDWKGDRSGGVVGGVRNVAGGKTRKADGQAYKRRYLDGVWGGLIALNRNVELAPMLARREGSEDLRDRLFHAGVTTLTGRVRGRVGFTQARNTPFQGLAADGAMLALYELVRAGYRVVAFVHDEVVIELPEGGDHAAEARRVDSIVNQAMERVTGDVPVACEYALSRHWSKQNKACYDANGRLIPWEERPA